MTRREEERARLWAEHLGEPGSFEWINAHRRPLPDHLNYQHHPEAPLPPGWEWARCLCFAVAVLPPTWHGQVRDRQRAIRYSVGPAVTYRHWNVKRSTWEGSVCDGCGAPLQKVEHPGDPYPWPFDTPPVEVAERITPCACHPVNESRPRPRLVVVEGRRGRKVS